MTNKYIAGIFLIDTRLLSYNNYLSEINYILLDFFKKYPEAYLTFALFDEEIEMKLYFEKVGKIPVLEKMSTCGQTKLFDITIDLISQIELLLPIYDIDEIYCFIACEHKDKRSCKYTYHDFMRIIDEYKCKGWKVIFIGK